MKDKLYHYTSLSSAISILSTSKLLMSNLEGLNDINESYRLLQTYFKTGDNAEVTEDRLKAAENELKKYWQASLSNDKDLPGFAIPAMWGHYGERGFGACIVLDKQILLQNLSPDKYTYNAISYLEDYNGEICIDGDPVEYFKRNKEKIFFRKTKDWEYEQEFRVICRTDKVEDTMIDIKDCIIAVVIWFAKGIDNQNDSCFSSLSYRRLNYLFPEIPILEGCISDNQAILRDTKGNRWYPEPVKICLSI